MSYGDFWLFYLREHGRPATRWLHFAGTGMASVLLVAAAIGGWWWLALLALLLGYGPAWLSHGLIEGNRPATFKHPLWSLISDLRMLALWLGGQLSKELDRAGVADRLPKD